MLRTLRLMLVAISTPVLLACDKAGANAASEEPTSTLNEQQAAVAVDTKNNSKPSVSSSPLPTSKRTFKTIEWVDLIPQDDLDALLNPPSYLDDIEDDSFEDQISDKILDTFVDEASNRYQQALVSTRIIPEMDELAVRIPGFVVPLEFDDDQIITEFFLVPYFGACIHSPPPPPNQIIFVHYPEGLELNTLYDPFWISGIMDTSLIENDVATAAYSMKMQSYEFYLEE